MRTLAIDAGSRRVGLAMSDSAGTMAFAHDVLTVTDLSQSAARILRLVEDEGVKQLVLGLPINMDDSIGPQAKMVIQFGRALAEKAKLPIYFVDERLSSFAAEQQLIDRKRAGEKITRGQKKGMLDALAARLFLQEFLEKKLLPIDVTGL